MKTSFDDSLSVSLLLNRYATTTTIQQGETAITGNNSIAPVLISSAWDDKDWTWT